MSDKGKSIAARLKNVARDTGKNYQLILIRYIQERILFRISKSSYRDSFCLKGGVLLYALQQNLTRSTKDLDLLGIGLTSDHEEVYTIFKAILSGKDDIDGLNFISESLSLSTISKNEKYPGIRIKVLAKLSNISQKMQIDIGYHDRITKGPIMLEFPTLLKMESPIIQAYSIETIIAEKFQAMVDLALLNSRMKDYYDVFTLLRDGNFSPEILSEAIQNTFTARATVLVSNHSIFTEDFGLEENMNSRWESFLRKTELQAPSFPEVHFFIRNKIKPLVLSQL